MRWKINHSNKLQTAFQAFEQNVKKQLGPITLVGVALGVLLPSTGARLQPLVMPLLFILMVFATMKIDLNRLKQALRQPRLLMVGLGLIYIVMPLTMYNLARLLHLPADLVLGVTFAALAPPIISAPFFVAMMEGDIEFSYVLSVIATLLAPLAIPILVFLIAGRTVAISIPAVVLPIVAVVILPGLLVLLLQRFFPKGVDLLKTSEGTITAIDFLLMVWAIIAANAANIFASSNTVLLLLCLAVVQGMGFFFLTRVVSRLFMPEGLSKALTLSISIKNVALTAGICLLISTTVALPSGMVVLVNVTMFTIIGLLKDRL